MSTSLEEKVLTAVYNKLTTTFTTVSVSFGTPDISNDGGYVWVASNISKDVYYYDANFEVYLIYIYVSSIDYLSAMTLAHSVRSAFHKQVLTLGTGFTNIHTYCASRDIIYEDMSEGQKVRTIRIIPVNIRAVKP